MSSENDQQSDVYKENEAQPLARMILSNPDRELTPKQLEALLKVLKDAPPLWPDMQQDSSMQPAEQVKTQDSVQPIEQIKLREPVQESNQQIQKQQIAYQSIKEQHPAISEPVKSNRNTVSRGNIPEKDIKNRRSALNNAVIVLLIILLTAFGFFGWYLWRTIFATFEYELQPVVILEGQEIDPNYFLAPGMNPESVTAVYRNPVFTPSIGQQDVQLTLIMGWRTVETTATLCVLTAISSFEHEFAEPGQLKAADFITNAEAAAGLPLDIRFIYTEEVLLLENYPVGEHKLYLALNEVPFEVTLTVNDTTAPEATPVNKNILVGEEVKPDDFVTDIFDASYHLPITVTYYGDEPDVLGHTQTVEIKVEDYYGNYNVFSAELKVRHNENPPVIEGTGDIIQNVGGVIRYMQGVTAYDDFGRDITSLVLYDDSGVDPFTVGVYTVPYIVTDFSGNIFEVHSLVHIINIDMDSVDDEVDTLLGGIIRDDLTQLQKVHAIFTWIRGSITYTPSTERIETVYEGAYRALRERRGNHNVYSSISELMFTRAGIPNMRIERINSSPVRHSWNLVDPDNLGWHHYDSYPMPLGLGIQMAYFTDSQAQGYTQQISNLAENSIDDYYTYNPELYPPITQ